MVTAPPAEHRRLVASNDSRPAATALTPRSQSTTALEVGARHGADRSPGGRPAAAPPYPAAEQGPHDDRIPKRAANVELDQPPIMDDRGHSGDVDEPVQRLPTPATQAPDHARCRCGREGQHD